MSSQNLDEELKYPELPRKLCIKCNEHPSRELELEGYANWYNAVYRCPRDDCNFAVVLGIDEDWYHKEEFFDGSPLYARSGGDG